MRALTASWFDGFTRRPAPLLLVCAAFVEIVTIVVGFRFLPVGLVLSLFLLVCALPFVALDNFRLLVLLLFLVVVLQVPRLQFPFMPLAYQDAIAYALLGLMGFNWVRERLDRNDLSWPAGIMPALWIALAFLVVVLTLRGLARDARPTDVRGELFAIAHYGVFFFAADAVRTPDQVRTIFRTLFLGTMIVCAEYLALILSGGAQSFRVISQQANLTLVAAPLLAASFITGGPRRLLTLAAFVPLMIVIILSGQRSLLLALPAALGLVVVLAPRTRLLRRGRLLVLLVAAALAGGVALLGVSSLRGADRGVSVGEGFTQRADPTEAASSASIVIRLVSYAYIWKHRVTEEPIFGWGIGNTANVPILRANNFRALRVDNSYLTLLWKGGVITLGVFLLWYAAFFAKGWRAVRHPSPEARVVALAILGCFAGVLVASLASSMVTHYVYNAIWATMMAILARIDHIYPRAGGDEPRRARPLMP